MEIQGSLFFKPWQHNQKKKVQKKKYNSAWQIFLKEQHFRFFIVLKLFLFLLMFFALKNTKSEEWENIL